jgi:hypothetical protein
MPYLCAIFLLIFWYVRPQDVVPSLAGVNLVRYLMILGVWAVLARPGGLKFGHVFRTPMDWIVMSYFAWMVFTTPEHVDAFKEVFTYAAFYIVTVVSLDKPQRILNYINCWMYCLLAISLLTLASHFGVEIVQGTNQLTAAFKGRMALNTWIFNNPNALGHSAVALIPLSVAWLWHHQPAIRRTLVISLVTTAGYCAVLTASKGAYISGAASLVSLYVFRRALWFQIGAAALVFSMGLGVLSFLPRMETLSAKDQGIAGRMMVWQGAMWSLKSNPYGVGLKKFQGMIEVDDLGMIKLATHGSFVRTGADLGYPGLFCYVGAFYVGYRTMRLRKFIPRSDGFRVQSAVFVLLISYLISAWVVDKAYHADFILLMALVSAVHRVYISQEESDCGTTLIPGSLPDGSLSAAVSSAVYNDEGPVVGWSKLTWYDVLIITTLLYFVVFAWDYLSTKFIPL